MSIPNSFIPAEWRGVTGPDSDGFVGISFDLEGDPETIFANIFTDIF